MGRIRNTFRRLGDALEGDKRLKGKYLESVLVGLLFQGGHVHIHTPLNKEHTRDIAEGMQAHLPVALRVPPKPQKVAFETDEGEVEGEPVRKVILQERHSPGDILTMTRAVADLKMTYPEMLIDVRSPCQEIWEGFPYLTPLEDNDPEAKVISVDYPGIHRSGWSGEHFADAFREDIENKLGLKIKKTGYRPEIHLREEEKHWINQVEVEFGWTGPFWILNAGRKNDNELKAYHRWQEFADQWHHRFEGKVKLVQVGHLGNEDNPHFHPDLKGVYNLVGKTDTRQLIRLAWWSHGTIGPISFQFVLAASLQKPHVVVAGGKEGVRWHIYPHGRFLYTNGALRCCEWDGCWLGGEKGKCRDLVETNVGTVPHCFELIKPHQIVDAAWMYYEGGMLNINERGI